MLDQKKEFKSTSSWREKRVEGKRERVSNYEKVIHLNDQYTLVGSVHIWVGSVPGRGHAVFGSTQRGVKIL